MSYRSECRMLFAFIVAIAIAHYVHAEDVAIKTKRVVQIHTDQSIFPQGTSVPLVFDFCNDGTLNVSFDMNHLGLPYGLNMELTYPDSEEMNARESKHYVKPGNHYDPPGTMPGSERIVLSQGSCIRLEYDLNEWFNLNQTGQYTLHLRFYDAELARFDFEIVQLNIIDDQVVRGFVDPLAASGVVVEEHWNAQCRVQTGTTGEGNDKLQFIFVKDAQIGMQQKSQQQFLLRVPVGTRVVRTGIDFRWRLWMLLRSEKGSAVVIGNLQDGTVSTAIEWTRTPIVFHRPWIGNPFWGYIVVAGKAGEPMLSTLSVSQPFEGRIISLRK